MMMMSSTRISAPESIHPPCAGYDIPKGISKYDALVRDMGKQAEVVAAYLNGSSTSADKPFQARQLQHQREGGGVDLSEVSFGRNSPVLIDHGERKVEAFKKFEQLQEQVAEFVAIHNFPHDVRLQALAKRDIMWKVPEGSFEKKDLREQLDRSKKETLYRPIRGDLVGIGAGATVLEFHDFIRDLPPHQRRGFLEARYIELARGAESLTSEKRMGYAAVLEHFGGVQFKGMADKLRHGADAVESGSRLAKNLRAVGGDTDRIDAIEPKFAVGNSTAKYEDIASFAELLASRLSHKVTPVDFVRTAILLREELISGRQEPDGKPFASHLAEPGLIRFSSKASMNLKIGRDVPLLATLSGSSAFASEVKMIIAGGPYANQN